MLSCFCLLKDCFICITGEPESKNDLCQFDQCVTVILHLFVLGEGGGGGAGCAINM